MSVFDGPTAVVSGRAALALWKVLALKLPRALPVLLRDLGCGEADVAAGVAAFADLERVAELWHADHGRHLAAVAALRGTGRGVLSKQMIGTEGAAQILGLRARRVRVLAQTGELAGEATTRGWRFDRADVLALAEERAR